MKSKKNKIWFIPLIVLFISLTMTYMYSYYFSGITSKSVSQFEAIDNMDNTYVRAHVLTYWVDSNACTDSSDYSTCQIVAKTPWNIDSTAINANWVLIDGYYYHSLNLDLESLNNEIPDDQALINPNLTANEISNEDLSDTQYIPQFEVIYEFLENRVGEDSKISTEDAWCVSFKDSTPEKVNGCVLSNQV